MAVAELREKEESELHDELLKLRKEQFALRMQEASGQLGQFHLLKEVKHFENGMNGMKVSRALVPKNRKRKSYLYCYFQSLFLLWAGLASWLGSIRM